MVSKNQKEYSEFIYHIANSKDLHEENVIKILEYAANTCFINDWNLLYLECKGLINERKRAFGLI